MLMTLGSAELVYGAAGFASVTTLGEDHNFVITLSDRKIDAYQQRLAHQLQTLNTKVDWVRPLTRRLQRLLGWGDVCATEKDVTKACERGDAPELLALMPAFSGLIRAGDLDQLPGVWKAMQPGAAKPITDCIHDFVNEDRLQRRVPGPMWGVQIAYIPYAVCLL